MREVYHWMQPQKYTIFLFVTFGTLFIIGVLIVLSLIPVYISSDNVEISRSNRTSSDLWKIQYGTNLSSISTRVVTPVSGPPLGVEFDEAMELPPGTILITQAVFFIVDTEATDQLSQQALTKQVRATTFRVILIIIFRIIYPKECRGLTTCQSLFEQQVLTKFLDRPVLFLSVSLVDGRIISFQTQLMDIVQNYIMPTTEATLPTSLTNSASTTTTTTTIAFTTIAATSTTTVTSTTIAGTSTTAVTLTTKAGTSTATVTLTTIGATSTTTVTLTTIGATSTTTVTSTTIAGTSTAIVTLTTTFAPIVTSRSLSVNQPKLCSNAVWNPNATTFANTSLLGINPNVVFVDRNNTVYISEQTMQRVQLWTEGSVNPTKTLSGNLSFPLGVFATVHGDIYIDNGNKGWVEKWSSIATFGVNIMNVSSRCYSLFVDNNNTIYCSLFERHQVVIMSLDNNAGVPSTTIGTGIAGSSSNMLNGPNGIFVDGNFNLYVADRTNNRIQKFSFGQTNGITIVGNGASSTITLNQPTGVVFDADGYIFIVELGLNRIIGSDSNGFRCIIGCSETSGSQPYELSAPLHLSFDSHGNLFVMDFSNRRVQKFSFLNSSCIT